MRGMPCFRTTFERQLLLQKKLQNPKQDMQTYHMADLLPRGEHFLVVPFAMASVRDVIKIDSRHEFGILTG